MSGFAKACGADMVVNNPVKLQDVPPTISIGKDVGVEAGIVTAEQAAAIATAASNDNNVFCLGMGSGVVKISNTTAFPDATTIGGLRCGADDGVPQIADGEENVTCTLTVDDQTGSVTGAWSPETTQ
jgi:hypothetical protein